MSLHQGDPEGDELISNLAHMRNTTAQTLYSHPVFLTQFSPTEIHDPRGQRESLNQYDITRPLQLVKHKNINRCTSPLECHLH